MGAQRTIIPQEVADQGFGLLKDIIDMVKNPQAVTDAYKAQQEAAQLTDEELKKYDEARVFISNAESLRIRLENRAQEIALQQQANLDAIAAHAVFVESEKKRLGDIESNLNNIAQEQAKTDEKNLADRAQLDSDTKQIKEDQDAREASLAARVQSVSDAEATNQEENNRLLQWENKLKAKASRLAAEAAS